MRAPQRRRSEDVRPPPPHEGRLFMDYLYMGFTFSVAIVVGKFLVASTAEEIVYFFESEENVLWCALLVLSLVFIGLYSVNFFYFGRHEAVVAAIRDGVRHLRSGVVQTRSDLSWLRNALSALQPNPGVRKRLQTVLRFFFRLNLVLHVAFMAACMIHQLDTELVLKDMVPFAIYCGVSFLAEEDSFESVLGHTGYVFVHVGAMLAHWGFDEASYVSVNTGISSLVLCAVWYIVNVPVRKTTKKQRTRN